MLLSFCRCQLRQIHHASINTATYVLGGRLWQGIWRVSWSPTRYLRSLWLWRCVLWRYGWLLTNLGQLRWINDWIIQWRRYRYHQWWQLIDILVTFLEIKVPVIMSVATTNTIWTWHDEWNMSLCWCCAHAILFVDGQKKVIANFFARQLKSFLSFSTRNKIDYEFFCLNIIKIRL